MNKFDMKPHDQNLEVYGKLCRERTKKYMVKNRQIQVFGWLSFSLYDLIQWFWLTFYLPLTSPELYFQVIGNDNGAHMRPMPGITFSVSSGPTKVNKFLILLRLPIVTDFCLDDCICMPKETFLLLASSCASLEQFYNLPSYHCFQFNNEHASKFWLQLLFLCELWYCDKMHANMAAIAAISLRRSLKPLYCGCNCGCG